VNGGNGPALSLWYRFICGVAYWGARILWGLRVEGRENIPPHGAAVVACNHRSLLDPPIVGCTLGREAGFLAKRELFESPLVAALVRSLNSIPIDRSRLSREKMGELADWLDTGRLLVMFPEGTRSKTGELGRPKPGIGVLLARKPVPVIPAWLEGTDSPFRNLFRRGRMRIVYGVPHAIPEEAGPSEPRARARAITEVVMDHIRALQEEMASPGEAGSRPAVATRDEAAGSVNPREG